MIKEKPITQVRLYIESPELTTLRKLEVGFAFHQLYTYGTVAADPAVPRSKTSNTSKLCKLQQENAFLCVRNPVNLTVTKLIYR